MAGAGGQRGLAAELWGVLLPPRLAAAGEEEESEEEAEEEPHLEEAALLDDSGPELEAALPPRRAGEGRRVGGQPRVLLPRGRVVALPRTRVPAVREVRGGRRVRWRAPQPPEGLGVSERWTQRVAVTQTFASGLTSYQLLVTLL